VIKGTAAKKQVFAMKVINKARVFEQGVERHSLAEREFLVASKESPWIVSFAGLDINSRFISRG
jgi:hypothetical protein